MINRQTPTLATSTQQHIDGMAIARALTAVLGSLPFSSPSPAPPAPPPSSASQASSTTDTPPRDIATIGSVARRRRLDIGPFVRSILSPRLFVPAFFVWLRAPISAMRPENLAELLRNGFSFISERLLGTSASSDSSSSIPQPPFNSATICVDRIRPAKRPADANSDDQPTSGYCHDYELAWRDDARDYIGTAGFEAVASLLDTWKSDLDAGTVTRCPHPDRIVHRFGERPPEPPVARLSAVVHNFMLERSGGKNTQDGWEEAVSGLAHAISVTKAWIAELYAPETFGLVKAHGVVPYAQLCAPVMEQYDGCCGLCAVGDTLAFAIQETQQWGHPGMRAAQTALMQVLVDLESFHRQRPILSYVVVEKQSRAPGYLYDDEGGVESVTAEELRNLWLHTSYTAPPGSPGSSVSLHAPPQQPICRVFGDLAARKRSRYTSQRGRVTSAAAASLLSARRTTDGSIAIKPGRPLYSPRADRFTPGPRQYSLPAKRKALTPMLLQEAKRSRIDKDAYKARRSLANAEARAAALVPLPMSPDTSDEDSTKAAASKTKSKTAPKTKTQERRIPATALFGDSDEESGPRLRISRLKAEELRSILAEKRALEEAERARIAEERRVKEEEERRKSGGLRAPSRHLVGSLSDAWRKRVFSTLRADPNQALATSPEGTPLRRKDFMTVVPKSEWLNDEIVNGVLLHLANHINAAAGITDTKKQTPKCFAFSSFFWTPLAKKGFAGTERWMKRVGITRANFGDIDTILIPICERSHWTIAVVRPKYATVTHMDSLCVRGGGRRSVTEPVLQWAQEATKDRGADAVAQWRVQQLESPVQNNGWDCGVHTITNAMCLSLGLNPACYGTADMPLQRDRIAAVLINGGFTGEFDLGGL